MLHLIQLEEDQEIILEMNYQGLEITIQTSIKSNLVLLVSLWVQAQDKLQNLQMDQDLEITTTNLRDMVEFL